MTLQEPCCEDTRDSTVGKCQQIFLSGLKRCLSLCGFSAIRCGGTGPPLSVCDLRGHSAVPMRWILSLDSLIKLMIPLH